MADSSAPSPQALHTPVRYENGQLTGNVDNLHANEWYKLGDRHAVIFRKNSEIKGAALSLNNHNITVYELTEGGVADNLGKNDLGIAGGFEVKLPELLREYGALSNLAANERIQLDNQIYATAQAMKKGDLYKETGISGVRFSDPLEDRVGRQASPLKLPENSITRLHAEAKETEARIAAAAALAATKAEETRLESERIAAAAAQRAEETTRKANESAAKPNATAGGGNETPKPGQEPPASSAAAAAAKDEEGFFAKLMKEPWAGKKGLAFASVAAVAGVVIYSITHSKKQEEPSGNNWQQRSAQPATGTVQSAAR